MNESLAKQLHDLISTAKLHMESEVDYQMDNMTREVNKLIENNKTQEKSNES
jgi:hypothetical protein